MKRRDLIRHLESHGCKLLREGGSHSIYTNEVTGRKETVPRHTEIKKHLGRSICRNLNVPELPGA